MPKLDELGMALPLDIYSRCGVNDYCLASIPDFNTLIAKSQEAQTPVYELTPEQIGQSGVVLKQTLKSRDRFKRIFSEFADKVIKLTTDARSD